jgi:hypothetical protein
MMLEMIRTIRPSACTMNQSAFSRPNRVYLKCTAMSESLETLHLSLDSGTTTVLVQGREGVFERLEGLRPPNTARVRIYTQKGTISHPPFADMGLARLDLELERIVRRSAAGGKSAEECLRSTKVQKCL